MLALLTEAYLVIILTVLLTVLIPYLILATLHLGLQYIRALLPVERDIPRLPTPPPSPIPLPVPPPPSPPLPPIQQWQADPEEQDPAAVELAEILAELAQEVEEENLEFWEYLEQGLPWVPIHRPQRHQ